MGYAHNNKRRNKNLSGSDVGHYLKGKGPHKNCKENKPVELYDKNVPYGGMFHAHNNVLLGGQGTGNFFRRTDRRTNNTYNYGREDGARGTVGEVTYVFYEPLRYPAFKMADRRSGGGAAKNGYVEKDAANGGAQKNAANGGAQKDAANGDAQKDAANGDAQKDAAKRNRRETSEEDKGVPPVGAPNGESCGGAEEASMTTTNLTHVGKTKKAGECNSGGLHHGANGEVVVVKKQRSRDKQGTKNQKSRDKQGMKSQRSRDKQGTKSQRSRDKQGTKSQRSRDKQGTKSQRSRDKQGTKKQIGRNPNEITNEVKFILHMTILTLYKDQIKPTYKQIKERLGTFHQNMELQNNFLEICLSLQNEYLVVKSKRNNIFVLLRETPKWFSGWIKTRSLSHLAVQFAKHLCRKGHLFFQSSDTLEGALGLFGQDSTSRGSFGQDNTSHGSFAYDSFQHGAIARCSALHGEPAGSSRGLFTFNLLHDSFSYFSHVNDTVVRLVDSSLVGLYQSILGEEENKAASSGGRSGEAASSETRSSEAASSGTRSSGTRITDSPIASEPPWELDSDIYKAAEGLKKRDLPFFSDYSVGRIAHIVQLGLYGGLLHEEGQVIKPACCCRGVAASVWGGAGVGTRVGTTVGAGVGGKMGRKINSQINSEVGGEVESPPREETGGGESEEASFTRNFKRHMEGEDANAVCSDADPVCSDADPVCSDASLPRRDAHLSFQNGGGSSKAGKYEGVVPLVPTAEDAKVKIDQLLKGSRKKIIYFCSFKDKFFKNFEQVLCPVQFGCRSLIEFLFFHCQEVCKLFLLNRNVILVHPSFDEQSVKDLVREAKEEEEDGDGDEDENVIEEFNYAEYVSNVTYTQKNSQTQQGSLQVCTVLKDLGKKKDNFFITFSFWKCVTGKGKAPTW
ncbi:hypothetical protein PCYB_132750 [Plasmodium cynomolgi strain B]|uniref:Uncharacterized protein n=1 Tax=Plasmodium cynomolgi (strain B) TaxID=1120755 RepID=K6UEI3_PLACD|nr:hypothetical protein PCYB_132750 [Plasmodium cynomolgi strain B]GAB68401.1 hypothetical protein PCYB_132750 [Plasmodium cynomolgi strain B]